MMNVLGGSFEGHVMHILRVDSVCDSSASRIPLYSHDDDDDEMMIIMKVVMINDK